MNEILNKVFNNTIPELQNIPITTYNSVLHQYETIDGGRFFRKDLDEGFIPINDFTGNFMYIRHNGKINTYKDIKLMHYIPLKLVAGFVNCSNSFEFAEALLNIMYKYIGGYMYGDAEINLNIQEILDSELDNKFVIKIDNLSLLSIEFGLKVPFKNICNLDALQCNTCDVTEKVCIGFPNPLIP